MISFILSALLALHTPSVQLGKATWYGSGGTCYDGHRRTCTPYASGEQVMYAAVGSWKYHAKPYLAKVCRVSTGKCVVVTVRDYCHACKLGRNLIDLSPAVFRQLAPLSRGRIDVTVEVFRDNNCETHRPGGC